MNSQNTPTFDLAKLHQAVKESSPNPHTVRFAQLKPVHEFIVELRQRKISYADIADLLRQHGIQTSRAQVARYGRIVLNDEKSRKRRNQTQPKPAVTAMDTKPTPTIPATPPPSPESPAKSEPLTILHKPMPFSSHRRWPRIAKVEHLPPGEKYD